MTGVEGTGGQGQVEFRRPATSVGRVRLNSEGLPHPHAHPRGTALKQQSLMRNSEPPRQPPKHKPARCFRSINPQYFRVEIEQVVAEAEVLAHGEVLQSGRCGMGRGAIGSGLGVRDMVSGVHHGSHGRSHLLCSLCTFLPPRRRAHAAAHTLGMTCRNGRDGW